MTAQEYPVFIRNGDGRGEVEEIARSLELDPATAGLHKAIYAERANQTVVMVTDRESPLARALRGRGWSEPRDPDPPSN